MIKETELYNTHLKDSKSGFILISNHIDIPKYKNIQNVSDSFKPKIIKRIKHINDIERIHIRRHFRILRDEFSFGLMQGELKEYFYSKEQLFNIKLNSKKALCKIEKHKVISRYSFAIFFDPDDNDKTFNRFILECIKLKPHYMTAKEPYNKHVLKFTKPVLHANNISDIFKNCIIQMNSRLKAGRIRKQDRHFGYFKGTKFNF